MNLILADRDRISFENLPRHILAVRSYSQLHIGDIGLGPIRHEIHRLGRPTDTDRENPSGSRIQSPGMTDFSNMQDSPQFGHHVKGSEAGLFVDIEDSGSHLFSIAIY